MYKVVKDFTDMKDDNHVYLAGDNFPREGVEVSKERVAELASKDNKRGEVLIKAVEQPQKAKISPVKEEKAKADEVVAKAETKPKKANKKKE